MQTKNEEFLDMKDQMNKIADKEVTIKMKDLWNYMEKTWFQGFEAGSEAVREALHMNSDFSKIFPTGFDQRGSLAIDLTDGPFI